MTYTHVPSDAISPAARIDRRRLIGGAAGGDKQSALRRRLVMSSLIMRPTALDLNYG